jgi:hypothetical protein
MGSRFFFSFLLLLLLLLTVHGSPLSAQIQDNSFLLEEAYNQEAGVVQHINAFSLSSEGDWNYSFTQEWPLGGIRHQLSYTIPLQHAEDGGTGLADIALNYRYQLIGNPEARTVMAPRFSVLFPTGDDEFERGTGGVSYQANLPLTLVLGPAFTTHWNAGATLSPNAHNTLGAQATTTSINLGASAIWLMRPAVNLVLETVWLSTESVVGEGVTDREEFFSLNPGIRVAFDLSGDLQIVPGIAYTIGLHPAELNNAVFLYLSFEHPFKRQ